MLSPWAPPCTYSPAKSSTFSASGQSFSTKKRTRKAWKVKCVYTIHVYCIVYTCILYPDEDLTLKQNPDPDLPLEDKTESGSDLREKPDPDPNPEVKKPDPDATQFCLIKLTFFFQHKSQIKLIF